MENRASIPLYSYTLECNYNSGRQSNAVSDATKDKGKASPSFNASPISHRYCIADFEEVFFCYIKY